MALVKRTYSLPEQILRDFDVACCERDLAVRFKWEPRDFPLPTIADALSRGQVLSDHLSPPFLFAFTGWLMLYVFRWTTSKEGSDSLHLPSTKLVRQFKNSHQASNAQRD